MDYKQRLEVLLESRDDFVIERLQNHCGFKVCVVNGEAVRRHSQDCDEFGNWAISSDFPEIIPEDEIWISDEAPKEERQFLLSAAMVEINDLENGKSAPEAYDHAIRKERSLRKKAHGVKFEPHKKNEVAPKQVYVKRLGNIKKEGLKLFLVDGEFIRDKYKTDFVDGGNGAVYDFVPNDELWVEDLLDDAERVATLVHEFVEFTLMTERNEDYPTAHGLASMVDWRARKELSIDDLSNMTKKWALYWVDKLDAAGGKD